MGPQKELPPERGQAEHQPASGSSWEAWLRQALHHIYDFPALRKNSLLPLLCGPEGEPPDLQRVLLDGIEALRPGRGVSPQSDAARTYRILRHRYVEQFSQAEVAGNLGMGIRQLRRYERRALGCPCRRVGRTLLPATGGKRRRSALRRGGRSLWRVCRCGGSEGPWRAGFWTGARAGSARRVLCQPADRRG